MSPPGRRFDPGDAAVFLAFLAVPLLVWPTLGDGFTGVKWHGLELLALSWLGVEALSRRPMPVPEFARRHRVALAALGAFTLASALRGGLAWGAEPLLARATFAALAFCSYGYFARNAMATSAVRNGLTASLAIVTAAGLAQVLGATRALGLEPLFGITAGDGRSATFGNANMAAQFVGFTAAFLVAARSPEPAGRWRRAAQDALIVAGLAYVFLLGTRSTMIGLGAAFAVVALLRARGRALPSAASILSAAVALALAVAVVVAGRGRASDAAPEGAKERSLSIRWALLEQSAKLVRDRPLGAGSGNFVHAFLPYQLSDERLRSESVVYASPHNEPLRALAEEGVVWCGLAGWLLFRLCAAVLRRARDEAWPPAAVAIAAGSAFLAVESAFQFPFAMAPGSLAAAVLLGLALRYVDGGRGTDTAAPDGAVAGRVAAGRVAVVAACGVAAFALARLFASDSLAAAAGDAGRMGRASDLNPRNTRAVLRASWLDARDGDRPRARARLAALLEHSPYYYPAIRLLGQEALAQGDARAGCLHLWIYDVLFGGRSSVHPSLATSCDPALLEGFRRHVRVPGYERLPMAAPAAGAEEPIGAAGER